MRRFIFIAVVGLFPILALSGPVDITLAGNFGASAGSPAVFDHQDYFVTFTIPDPHSPDRFFDAPGGIGQVSAIYAVPGRLAVAGIGFSVSSPIEAVYNSQAPLGLWLNIGVFQPLPVGEFLILTPLQTLNGTPLWNGLAGARGTPEITLLTDEPVSTRWFLEQNTPDRGPIPLAIYDTGTATITVTATAVPEPATMPIVALALLVFRVSVAPTRRAFAHLSAVKHSSIDAWKSPAALS